MGEICEVQFKLFKLNPKIAELDQPSKLIDYLHDLKLFGTKYGCGEVGSKSCTGSL
jgi:aerobic-type carbon monoxide dehydrogenase small subunit (CoxS/CutS family)